MDYSYCSSELNWTALPAQSINHFTTELPSLLQVNWYSTCVLKLLTKPQTTQPSSSLYPTFVVYLTMIRHRFSLCRTSLLCVNVCNNNWNVVHFTGVFFTISLLSHNYYISQRTFSYFVLQRYEMFFTFPNFL